MSNQIRRLVDIPKAEPTKFVGNPMYAVFRWQFTGNAAADENYFFKIQDLAEEHNGDFYCAYAFRGIYDVEIGGEFESQKDADAFTEAVKQVKQPKPPKPRKKAA